MNIRARWSIPSGTGVARPRLPAVRRRVSTRLALVVSLLLALLLATCDSSPAPVLKTPTATANLASEDLYVACSDGIIQVLRARDGAVVAQLYETASPSADGPALSAGVLYYGEYGPRDNAGNLGDTALVARDITTGRELWRTATPGNVTDPPVIQQDTVYVAVYVAPKHVGDDPVSVLLALDARSGAIRWRYDSREVIVGSPTVNGDTMWATASSWTIPPVDSSRSLLALRAHDGTLLWRVPLADIPSSSPVLAQGILYVGSWLGALYALRADTGATVWVYHAAIASAITPSVLDGVVYGSAYNGAPCVLNAADGRSIWTQSSIARHPGWGTFLAQDQTLYAGSPGGLLYALDARTGATLRTYHLDNQPPITGYDPSFIIWSAPILRGGVLYIERAFARAPGEVVAIDRDTGAVRWTQTLSDTFCSPPVIG